MTDQRPSYFNARWNTGDGSPLSDYILKMFRYAKRSPDVDVTAMYVDRLKHLPLDEIKVVWESLLPDTLRSEVPSIELILREHARRKRDQNERRESAKQKPKPGEFDTIKRSASAAYCNRVCDMTPPGTESYHGDFDYMAVVNSVPIPSANERGTQKHKPYWDEFFRRLEESWQIWQAS